MVSIGCTWVLTNPCSFGIHEVRGYGEYIEIIARLIPKNGKLWRSGDQHNMNLIFQYHYLESSTKNIQKFKGVLTECKHVILHRIR